MVSKDSRELQIYKWRRFSQARAQTARVSVNYSHKMGEKFTQATREREKEGKENAKYYQKQGFLLV
jgi:hypothetical protein